MYPSVTKLLASGEFSHKYLTLAATLINLIETGAKFIQCVSHST